MNPERPEAESNPIALKIQDEIAERSAKIALFYGDNIFSQYAEQYPEAKAGYIRLYEEEIEVLSALDPTTTTLDEIHEITLDYHMQREALNPNK